MPILDSELALHNSQVRSLGGGNGGLMEIDQTFSGLVSNIFDPVFADQNSVDITRYRKVYLKINNSQNLEPTSVKIGIFRTSTGGDEVTVFSSSGLYTQADLLGTEDHSGGGILLASISANSPSMQVTTEVGSIRPIFHDGMEILISNKSNPADLSGDQEYVKLDSSSAVAWSGNTAILTFDPNFRPLKTYAHTVTYITEVISLSDFSAKADSFVVTSTSGGVNNATAPILVNSIGGTNQIWTLTMTTPTSFTCTGSKSGFLPLPGSFAVDYEPQNPAYNSPYFTIDKAIFSGSFLTGDTIQFTTHPVSDSFWLKQFTPSGNSAEVSDFRVFAEVV